LWLNGSSASSSNPEFAVMVGGEVCIVLRACDTWRHEKYIVRRFVREFNSHLMNA
jgi:hypothetical protein